MANTNTTTYVIDQLLAQGLLALRQMAVMPRFVNRTYEQLAGEKMSSVAVPIPSSITAAAVTPSYVPPDDTGISPTQKVITLDQWYEAPFFLNDKEMVEVAEGTIPMQASEAVKAIANNVDNAILAKYKDVGGFSGTAGTTPFATDLSEFLEADKVLNQQLAPMDPRYIVINPAAAANAKGLRALQDASWRNDPQAMRRNDIGDVLGYTWSMDQNMPYHTAGTITTGLICKAATAVAAGAKTFLGTTAASTGACALLTGDVIAIAGHTKTYALTANATQASASTDVTITISEGLETALAGSEAITVKSSHRVNLAFHRDAFALASRPFSGSDPMALGLFRAAVDPVSGLTLRLEVSRQHKRTRFAYDILYGVQCVRPELAARIAG